MFRRSLVVLVGVVGLEFVCDEGVNVNWFLSIESVVLSDGPSSWTVSSLTFNCAGLFGCEESMIF
jgi:hypothetical protein